MKNIRKVKNIEVLVNLKILIKKTHKNTSDDEIKDEFYKNLEQKKKGLYNLNDKNAGYLGINMSKLTKIYEDNETIDPSAFGSIGTVEITGSTITKDLSETDSLWGELAFNSPGREMSASGVGFG